MLLLASCSALPETQMSTWPHDKWWSQVSELQGRQLSAADLHKLNIGTDIHARDRQEFKPCMQQQQRHIHTPFGGLLSLSPPQAMFSQSHPHTAALGSACLIISSEQHTFTGIMFSSQETIIHVKQLLDYSKVLLITARRKEGGTPSWWVNTGS